uniref:Uncharacterized protein n=1 Tax=Oryza brachyantha TaxID=4533 RepID=J3KXN3_ORYBR
MQAVIEDGARYVVVPGQVPIGCLPIALTIWDGIHLTEAAYARIAAGWLHGPYAHPRILAAERP